MLHLGATDWLPLAPASDGTHQGTFFVQPQSEDPEGVDPAFTTVFDGSLLLPDGRIAVGDVEQLTPSYTGWRPWRVQGACRSGLCVCR